MKKLFTLTLLPTLVLSMSLDGTAQSLKTVLMEQLKTTHKKKEWFVPVNVALAGLTPEQAMWKDGSGNHSVGQLAYHLLFWNQRELLKFKGEKEAAFSGNNEETFSTFDKNSWNQTVTQLDQILTELEKMVQEADEAKLKSWAPEIANISFLTTKLKF